ncbi:hypothetical protein, partial [Hominenteromicrobium sp.]|uniref:hypothetical protein n=1 Tax=Hominenteromicrobium sp. TaxID=3073581 RepID=UPI003AB619F7
AIFLSTPSGWRATDLEVAQKQELKISIHALRVEGDVYRVSYSQDGQISIHALRVEGDQSASCTVNVN